MRELQTKGGAAITEEQRSTAGQGPRWRLRLVAILIAGVGVALDQIAKAVAVERLEPGVPIPLIDGFLNLLLVRNPGAAFSMGEQFTVVISVVALAATGFVLGWLIPRLRHRGWAVITGLLLAGIVGNLIDRLLQPPSVLRGHVIDFLQVPWFVFNLADVWITFAAVGVVWLSMITQISPDGVSLRQETPE